jgi:hypothetical protein
VNYLQFLQLLLSLGPKLTQVWPHIQTIIAEVKAIIGIVEPTTPSVAHQCQCDAAELEVMKLIAPDVVPAGNLGAIGDGTIIKAIFAFLQANPWLLQLVISILTNHNTPPLTPPAPPAPPAPPVVNPNPFAQ